MMQRILPLPLLVVLLLSLGYIAAAYTQPATEGRFADMNGARIFYTITGQGEPLVLIHGYPLSGDLFSKQREALSHTFQVITLDLRGFGRSVAPDEQASIDLYTGDVLALMDVLGIQQAVIGGHSMGGIITLNLYRRAPERFRGMLLIDTVAASASTVEQFMWRGYARQGRAQGAASLLPLLLPEFLTGETRQHRPELVAAVADLILQASTNGLVGGANTLAERPDLTGVLSTITVPTLILFGLEDSLTPIETAHMLQAGIPNAQLAILDRASHGAISERAPRTNRTIRLWAAQTLGLSTALGSSGD